MIEDTTMRARGRTKKKRGNMRNMILMFLEEK
jgi:hypothetical protein